MDKIEKIRILVGLHTDRSAYDLLERAKSQMEISLSSHAEIKKQASNVVLQELERSDDTAEIEKGVLKFVEWIKS